MDLSKFKHIYKVKVQFHEVDLLGVCNNAVYLNFFETARLEYMKEIGQYKSMEEVMHDRNFFLIVRNECDYIEPAFYDDELNVYSRIKYVKNSSFGFEHIVEKAKTKKIIAKGGGVIVYIDRASRKSTPLPTDFLDAVNKNEPEVKILRGEK